MQSKRDSRAVSAQTQQIKLDRLLLLFLETKRSPETIRAYKRVVNCFLHDLFPDQELREVEFVVLFSLPFSLLSERVSSFVIKHKKINKHTGKIINPRSVNRCLYALSSFFVFLERRYDFPRNPCRLIEALPVPRHSSTVSPSSEDVRVLLGFLASYKDRGIRKFRNTVLVLCLFLLALRRSEAVSLQWREIDLDRGVLSLVQKGGTRKELPVPEFLQTLLSDFRSRLQLLGDGHPFVFHALPVRAGDSRPLSSGRAYSIVLEVLDRALGLGERPEMRTGVGASSCLSSGLGAVSRLPTGLNEVMTEGSASGRDSESRNGSRAWSGERSRCLFTPHSLRKAFIEHALDLGSDLVSIANATGHSSIEMVKYYDTRDRLKNNAIHEVSRLFDW